MFTHPPATDEAPPIPGNALSMIVILTEGFFLIRWNAVAKPARPPPMIPTLLGSIEAQAFATVDVFIIMIVVTSQPKGDAESESMTELSPCPRLMLPVCEL